MERGGEETGNNSFSYSIETDVPLNYIGNLLDFIYQQYILPQGRRFSDASTRRVDDVPSLTFTLLDSMGKPNLYVEIIGSKPIQLKILPLEDAVPEKAIDEVKQDVVIAVELFEEKVRASTLFFAWREGQEIVPEEIHGKEKKPINRLFLETQILLFMVFIGLSVILFLILGWLTPLVLIAIQFLFVFYSDRFTERIADWRITEENPSIHILEYRLPPEEYQAFRERYSRDTLMEIKKDIYEKSIVEKGEVNCETAHQVFLKYGFDCKSEDLTAKKVNVYQLVKRAASEFGFSMPKVVVSNTMIPNAAASGPSPSRGVVLITTGLLVQLDEDEILSVLGHEFGHLKGRDPLLLYGLTAGEYLFRFYVLFPLFPVIFLSSLFFFYFWAVMTIIFFIAKFFEARADLLSAIVIRQPRVLAEALEKIGFRRLMYERTPSYRFQEWLSLDPHPPIYFRVERLEKLKDPTQIKQPLVQSIKDVTNGFLASFE